MTFYQLKTRQTGIEVSPYYENACRCNQVEDQGERAGVIMRRANQKRADKRSYY